MSNPNSHNFYLIRAWLYFFCLIVISLSPLAVRWATTAAHMEIFRDSTGQPSDLLEKAAAPASPNTEHSSETHRGKMMGIRPANSNEKGMTTAELNASSQRPIIR